MSLDRNSIMVFSGSANRPFAESVCRHLGIPLGQALVGCFSDGEAEIEIQENVRGRDVFVIQPTSFPTNDHLVELILMIDALFRSSAGRITAAMPYFGYARQDRRPQSARVPISAKVVANMLTSVGVNRVLTVDLHSDQIQGFFDVPVDNIYATPVLLADLMTKWRPGDMVVVSPDVGGVVRARAVAKRLGSDLAIIDKRRPHPNEAQVMNIIGDVAGRVCVIVDDMVDTGNTLVEAAAALKRAQAARVLAYCTHPVLSGKVVERIQASCLDEIVVTDTIPLSNESRNCPKIRQLSISALFAETIRRISEEDSVSMLFAEPIFQG